MAFTSRQSFRHSTLVTFLFLKNVFFVTSGTHKCACIDCVVGLIGRLSLGATFQATLVELWQAQWEHLDKVFREQRITILLPISSDLIHLSQSSKPLCLRVALFQLTGLQLP